MDKDWSGTATGTNTYSVTISKVTATAPYNFQTIYVRFANDNTGASTLKLNSYTARNITLNGAALTGGEIITTATYILKYNTTTTSWELQPYQAGSGGASAWKITGNAGTVDGTNFIGTTDNIPFNIRVNNQKSGEIETSTGNTFFGYQSGNVSSSNLFNTGFGFQTLMSNTTNSNNTAIGGRALSLNTTGTQNTASGSIALYSNTTGGQNTANGMSALYSNTSGGENTANGVSSLYSNTTGSFNTTNGFQSLYYNTTGGQNTASGKQALHFNTTASDNTANGFQALYSNTTGINNTASGSGTLRANTTGGSNAATGFQSLYSNTTGSSNTANGAYALNSNTTGSDNTSSGRGSLAANTTGGSNTANGAYSLNANTTGGNNTANGASSLLSNTTGYGNTGAGRSSLYSNTTGYQNTAIGDSAMITNTSGFRNTALGYNAFPDNLTGTYNTAIGYNAMNTVGALTNATAIGANSEVSTSNSLVLGGLSTYSVNVGIGTSAPTSILDIFATTNGAIRATRNETSATSQFLTLRKSNGAVSAPSVVVTNDGIATISMQGYDGAAYVAAATIKTEMEGNASATSMPGRLVFSTTATGSVTVTEKMRIDNAGNVGIGTSSPTNKLSVESSGTTPLLSLNHTGSLQETGITFAENGLTKAAIYHDRVNKLLTFYKSPTISSPAMVIDSLKRVGIGTTAPSVKFEVATSAVADRAIYGSYYGADANGWLIVGNKSRNATVGSHTIVQNNDDLLFVEGHGSDGTNFETAGLITFAVDGTPGANDMPGRLTFWTTPDGSNVPVQRMRINNAGAVLMGYSTATASGELFGVQKNQNAATVGMISNTTSGTAARSYFGVSNSATNSPGLYMIANSAGYTTSGMQVADAGVLLSDKVAGLNVGTSNASPLSFWTNNTQKATILSNGNVGIGTSTPLAALEVNNTATSGFIPTGIVANFASTSGIYGGIAIGGNATGNRAIKIIQTAAGYAQIQGFSRTAGAALDFSMQVDGGNVGIGLDVPTAKLHIASGTTAASTAPLKFTSGSLNTTAEAGAVEFLTDDYYATITTGAARHKLARVLTGSATLDFANLAAIGCSDLTITVTGAVDGDDVVVSPPNVSMVANSTFTAWVSAANTVSVRFCTLISGDPASGTFKVTVIKN